ncbi:MAG: hypothetical protein JHD16_00855 [Solirubrobacteraceae bacterium]|nr:hypothetical protein [Solirubrobacteraceae bacterium]
MTARAVVVEEAGKDRTVARVNRDDRIDQFLWSGDGRQLAWLQNTEEPSYEQSLHLVDVRTGVERTWKDVYGLLTPSPRGVAIGAYNGRFHEYLPDGAQRSYRVTLPATPKRRKALGLEPASPAPSTETAFATPINGDWLVPARLTGAGPEGSRYDLVAYRADTASTRVLRPSRGEAGIAAAVRIDDRRVVWATQAGTECAAGNSLAGYGLKVPNLPESIGAVWIVRELSASGESADLIARRMSFLQGSDTCASTDGGQRTWFHLRRGKWQQRGEGVADVAVASDGRIARVNGTVPSGKLDVGLEADELAYGSAWLEPVGGERTPLPKGTRAVAFSPASPMTLRTTVGDGPALTSRAVLTPSGVGALQLGRSLASIRAATSTALTTLSRNGRCTEIRATDLRLDNRLGVRGTLVDDTLEALSVTTRDTKIDDEDDYGIGDLQPGVKKVVPRGPRTWRGVRAGDALNDLVAAHGMPARRTTRSRQGAVEYEYQVKGGLLVARADANATVRRIDLFRGGTAPSCAARD